MKVRMRLYPPLNNAAGRERVALTLPGDRATIQDALDALTERFGGRLRRHLYDSGGRLVPAWCAFVNNKPVYLNRPQALSHPLKEGDEISLLLALAGG